MANKAEPTRELRDLLESERKVAVPDPRANAMERSGVFHGPNIRGAIACHAGVSHSR